MVKKTTSFRVEPRILKELKLLSFEREKPIGDILEALVTFSQAAQYVDDESFQKRFKNLLEMAFDNAGRNGVDGPTAKEKKADIEAAKKKQDEQ